MRQTFHPSFNNILLGLAIISVAGACTKPGNGPGETPRVDTVVVTPTPAFNINNITDTYESISSFANYNKWSVYNVHDPAIKKFGDYYYCYSTDVAYGYDGSNLRPGIQVRKSKDLVEWTFVGWVFNGLPSMGAGYISSQATTPFNSLWAPYVLKVGAEYRLYYSLSSPKFRTSVIGLATATSPEGPWTERGLVVTSNSTTVQTNAIDPTVIVTTAGEHWMYYGSAYDGIYSLKLDPATGLSQMTADKGTRIAQRGFTGPTINGNIEGPEIIFNEVQNKYYLFISYDWLETKYNVRVGRSDNPQGPFLDYNGIDINTVQDHGPMILAPYQFGGHGGWQGTAHPAVFKDDAGQYFMAHQGRPGVNKFFMDLHVRKIFWTQNGWPVVSPQRYAYEDNSAIPQDSIAGQWEKIKFNYTVVPGYANEQLYPDFQVATMITLNAGGAIAGGGSWMYAAPWLQLTLPNGSVEKLYVQKGRDWEAKKSSVIFTGLNETGTAIWGKKK